MAPRIGNWETGTERRLRSALFLVPLLLLPLVLPLPLSAQRRARPTAAERWLAERIGEVIGRGEADRGFWGIEVFAPQRGQTLYSLNAHRFFTPASVTKLFTSGATLAVYGADYQFRTTVETTARVDAFGRLLGDLYLVGRGDPNLSGRRLPYAVEFQKRETWEPPLVVLEKLADQVVAAGVRVITGDLIADDSFFAPERFPADWAVGDTLWSYGAAVSALAVNDNSVTLRVEPGEREGDPARLSWLPETGYFRAVNRIATVASGDRTELSLRREPGGRELTLSGTIALDQKARELVLAVDEPAEFAAAAFRALLEARGVRVEGSLRVHHATPTVEAPEITRAEDAAEARTVLAEHLSLPLSEGVKVILKESQNLHAEMLLRLLGRKLPPASPLPPRKLKPDERPPRLGNGSAEAGLEVLRALLANAGVNPHDVVLEDGSGLARGNLVTPHGVVQWLKFVQAQPWREAFLAALPAAGVDGTLKDRMKQGPAYNRVRAKTGTLGSVNALAGFIETQSGEPLLFAIFVNHHTLENQRALDLIDELAALLAELPPAATRPEKRN